MGTLAHLYLKQPWPCSCFPIYIWVYCLIHKKHGLIQHKSNLVSHVTCHVLNVTFNVTSNMWHLTPDMCHLTWDTWRMTNYTWNIGDGEHYVKMSGWGVTCDTWHVTCDTGHVTRDTGHMTCDTQWVVNTLSKFQGPSSKGLELRMFWRYFHKGWMTLLINNSFLLSFLVYKWKQLLVPFGFLKVDSSIIDRWEERVGRWVT